MADGTVDAAEPDAASEGAAIHTRLSGNWVEDEAAMGQGLSPFLQLDGFTGPLDHLLILARAQTIDLATLSLTTLIAQLTAALVKAPATMPLGQKADWVVMAAWLVQLRARLLLPADTPGQQAATADAAQLRNRLMTLQTVQALAGWLDHRPQLGHDVLARGQPEVFGVSADAGPVVDIIAFLWTSLALFDDDMVLRETTPLYRPQYLDLYAVTEARDCILQRLADVPEGLSLDRLLPKMLDDTSRDARQILRHRSAWSSTFVASLELAKQGDVVLEQPAFLDPVHVQAVSTGAAGGLSDQPGCPC